MTYTSSKRISGVIRLWCFAEIQKHLQDPLYLPLFSSSIPRYRLFDLEGGIFVDGYLLFINTQLDHPSGLADSHGCCDISEKEQLLYRSLGRLKFIDDRAYLLINLTKSVRQFLLLGGLYYAMGKIRDMIPLFLNKTIPNPPVTRINSNYSAVFCDM